MAYNTITLDLDPTGINPDNRIVDEPHNLSSRPTRSIAPKKGPFYADSVYLMDGARRLDRRGIDFQIVELHQETTLKFGKEISEVILVLDSSVSSNVTVTYQALGGHYQNTSAAVANLYESVINDNRPVDWTNIFNRPTEFNPTIHRHLLDDVYGFEPVVDYLERIKRAITLGQTEVLLSAIKGLLSKFDCKELPKVKPNTKLIQYDALLYFLSRRKILSNIWIDTVNCTWYKGDSASFDIDTSGYPLGTTLHWELYKPYGSISLFSQTNGAVQANGGVVRVSLYVPAESMVMDNPIYLGVKESLSDDEYKAVSYQLNIQEHQSTTEISGYLYGFNTEPNDLEMFIGDLARDDDRRLYYMLNYR